MKNKKMPLNIQLFAVGEGTEPVTQTEPKTEGTGAEPVKQTEQGEVKTFTQEEVNAMLAKERKKIPNKEELKEFNDWKESQKTEIQKQQEKDIQIANLLKENSELKNFSVVANAEVDKKFQKFVVREVSELDGDFEENLKTYLKENPQFLTQKEEKKTTTTGFSQNTINKGVSEEKAYLDKKYANNPYYKK